MGSPAMSKITRRTVPAMLAAAAASVTTALNAGPAIDPVHAAIEAVRITTAAHEKILTRLSRAEATYWAQRDALPCPEYEGVTFKTRNEVDAHFDAPTNKAAIALAIRNTLAAAAGMGELAERFNPTEEPADVKAAREAARAQVHQHMTAYLRVKDELRHTSGYVDASRADSIAGDVLSKAEEAALSTVPTTIAGAQALASFAGAYCGESAGTVLRSISAFLARSA
jgi:hypothetical protein